MPGYKFAFNEIPGEWEFEASSEEEAHELADAFLKKHRGRTPGQIIVSEREESGLSPRGDKPAQEIGETSAGGFAPLFEATKKIVKSADEALADEARKTTSGSRFGTDVFVEEAEEEPLPVPKAPSIAVREAPKKATSALWLSDEQRSLLREAEDKARFGLDAYQQTVSPFLSIVNEGNREAMRAEEERRRAERERASAQRKAFADAVKLKAAKDAELAQRAQEYQPSTGDVLRELGASLASGASGMAGNILQMPELMERASRFVSDADKGLMKRYDELMGLPEAEALEVPNAAPSLLERAASGAKELKSRFVDPSTRFYQERATDPALQYLEQNEEGLPWEQLWRKIKHPRWLPNKMAENIPQLALAAATASGPATFAQKMVSPGAALIAATESGQAMEELERERPDAPNEVVLANAVVRGGLNTVFEMIGGEAAVGRLIPDDIIAKIGNTLLKRAAVTGVAATAEPLEEGMQQVNGAVTLDLAKNPPKSMKELASRLSNPHWWDDKLKDVPEAMVVAAATGGAFGAATSKARVRQIEREQLQKLIEDARAKMGPPPEQGPPPGQPLPTPEGAALQPGTVQTPVFGEEERAWIQQEPPQSQPPAGPVGPPPPDATVASGPPPVEMPPPGAEPMPQQPAPTLRGPVDLAFPEAQTTVARLNKTFRGGLPLVLHGSQGELPERLREMVGGDLVEGVRDPETGAIHIVHENIRDRNHFYETIVHEALGHDGFRTVLGPTYTKFLDSVWSTRRQDIETAPWMATYQFDLTTDLGRKQATDEFVAREVARVLREEEMARDTKRAKRPLWVNRFVSLAHAGLNRVRETLGLRPAPREHVEQLIRAGRWDEAGLRKAAVAIREGKERGLVAPRREMVRAPQYSIDTALGLTTRPPASPLRRESRRAQEDLDYWAGFQIGEASYDAAGLDKVMPAYAEKYFGARPGEVVTSLHGERVGIASDKDGRHRYILTTNPDGTPGYIYSIFAADTGRPTIGGAYRFGFGERPQTPKAQRLVEQTAPDSAWSIAQAKLADLGVVRDPSTDQLSVGGVHTADLLYPDQNDTDVFRAWRADPTPILGQVKYQPGDRRAGEPLTRGQIIRGLESIRQGNLSSSEAFAVLARRVEDTRRVTADRIGYTIQPEASRGKTADDTRASRFSGQPGAGTSGALLPRGEAGLAGQGMAPVLGRAAAGGLGPEPGLERPTFALRGEEKKERELTKHRRDMMRRTADGQAEAVSPEAFLAAMQRNPEAQTLSHYTPEEIADPANRFKFWKLPHAEIYWATHRVKRNDGKPGLAYEGTNLFSNEGAEGAGIGTPAAILHQLEHGVDQFDCYDVRKPGATMGFLPERYSRFGFETIRSEPFDPKYSTPEERAIMEEQWRKLKWEPAPTSENPYAGHPGVAYMRWTGRMPDGTVLTSPKEVRAWYLKQVEDAAGADVQDAFPPGTGAGQDVRPVQPGRDQADRTEPLGDVRSGAGGLPEDVGRGEVQGSGEALPAGASPGVRPAPGAGGRPPLDTFQQDWVRLTAEGRNIVAHLQATPMERISEKEGLQRWQMLDRIGLVLEKIAPIEKMKAAALAGIAKKGWYADSAKALREMFGADTERFVGVLAATSPQNGVPENLKMALRVYDEWIRRGKPTDPAEVKAMFPKVGESWQYDEELGKDVLKPKYALVDMEARLNNTITSLTTGGPLSGMKVESFRNNLLGNFDPVTNDAWMAYFHGIGKNDFSAKSVYLAGAVRAREVAEALGWTPAEVQETVWTFYRTLANKIGAKTSGRAALETLTHGEIIGASDDFLKLTEDPDVRRLLDQLRAEHAVEIPEVSQRTEHGVAPTDVVFRNEGNTAALLRELAGQAERQRYKTKRDWYTDTRERFRTGKLTRADIDSAPEPVLREYARALALPEEGGPSESLRETVRGRVGAEEAPQYSRRSEGETPVFYSQLQRAIDQLPRRFKAEDAWRVDEQGRPLGLLAKLGVKPEEVEWTTVGEWLEERRGQLVTREELARVAKENEVTVEEVLHGPPETPSGRKPEGEDDDTKFSQYTLPGGKDYRELLLTLPETRPVGTPGWETGELYRSAHWDEPNILAHVRFNERTDTQGRRVLFVEEIQSDWHQKGRETGYRGTSTRWEAFSPSTGVPVRTFDTEAEARAYADGHGYDYAREGEGYTRGDNKVPNAPFKKTWPELAFKRVLRWAVENGFDSVAWTTGAQQAERYSLGNRVKSIEYAPAADYLSVRAPQGHELIDRRVTRDELPGIIGKELAQRLLASELRKDKYGSEFHHLEGDDLDIGGLGMKGFYDAMLPSAVQKMVKKWGGRVEQVHLPAEEERRNVFGVGDLSELPPGTEPLSRSEAGDLLLSGAQDIWEATRTDFGFNMNRLEQRGFRYTRGNPILYRIPEQARKGAAVHSVTITPAMRESVMGEGLPLFAKRERGAESDRAAEPTFSRHPFDPGSLTSDNLADLSIFGASLFDRVGENYARWASTFLDELPEEFRGLVDAATLKQVHGQAKKIWERGGKTAAATVKAAQQIPVEDLPRGTEGRPDLANPAKAAGAEAGAFLDEIDEIRTRLDEPAARDYSERDREADRILADPDFRKALIRKGMTGQILSDAETIAAKTLMAADVMRAIQSRDREQIARAAALADAYRRTGSAWSSSGQARQELDNGDPVARVIRFLGESILAPVNLHKWKDRARTEYDPANYKRLLTEHADETVKLLRALDESGVDIDGRLERIAELRDEYRFLNKELLGDDGKAEAEPPRAITPAPGEPEASTQTVNAYPVSRRRPRLPAADLRQQRDRAGRLLQGEVAGLVRDVSGRRADLSDKLYEYWINSILSAPLTHERNILGNTLSILMEYALYTPLEHVLGSATGGGKQVGDLRHLYGALGRGWARGIANAAQAWATETRALGPMADVREEVLHGQKALKGKWGRTVRIPGRGLLAADEFYRGLIGEMEASAAAHRIARTRAATEGWDAARQAEHTRQLLDDYESPAWKEATDRADLLTFQSKLGPIGGALLHLRTVTPTGRYWIPFVRTVLNLFKRAVELSPAGIVKTGSLALRGELKGDVARRQIVQQAVAWSMAATVAVAVLGPDDDDDEPVITGSLTKKQRLAQRDIQGRSLPEQSIRIGTTWYSYKNIEPFATWLSGMVDALEGVRQAKDGRDVLRVISEFGDKSVGQITDKTFLQGIGQVYSAIEDSTKRTKWAANFLASWVPNALRQTAEAFSPTVRETRTWGGTNPKKNVGETWWSRETRRTLDKAVPLGVFTPRPPSRFSGYGRAVEKPKESVASRLFNPIETLDTSKVPAAERRLDRLISTWNRENPDDQWWPAVPAPETNVKVTVEGKRTTKTYGLTDKQYADYQREAGQRFLRRASEITGGLRRLDEGAVDRLKKAQAKARKDARRTLGFSDKAFLSTVE